MLIAVPLLPEIDCILTHVYNIAYVHAAASPYLVLLKKSLGCRFSIIFNSSLVLPHTRPGMRQVCINLPGATIQELIAQNFELASYVLAANV